MQQQLQDIEEKEGDIMGKSKNSRTLEVLKNLVGDDLFQTVLEVFAGQKLSFPKNPDSIGRDARNKQIQIDYSAGRPVSDLVDEYDLSESQIYKILGRVS